MAEANSWEEAVRVVKAMPRHALRVRDRKSTAKNVSKAYLEEAVLLLLRTDPSTTIDTVTELVGWSGTVTHGIVRRLRKQHNIPQTPGWKRGRTRGRKGSKISIQTKAEREVEGDGNRYLETLEAFQERCDERRESFREQMILMMRGWNASARSPR